MSEHGLNKVMLIGRSGGDADLKFTSGGKPIASFSIAMNESFKTRDGEKNDRVEWFRCVCWNKLSEIAAQYVTTGKGGDRGANGNGNTERREAAAGHPQTSSAQEQVSSLDDSIPF